MEKLIFKLIILVLLLNNCSSVDTRNYPDYVSCNEKKIEELFNDGSSVNVKSQNNVPLISYYARFGNLECVKKLILMKADVNITDDKGWTPLIYSVYSKIEIMQLLIENGAKIEQISNDGGNSLILASELGRLDNLKLLLDNKANVNHLTKNKGTPLMHAAIRGHTSIVDELLKRGGDPNIVDFKFISPLMHAASNGHLECVKLLIKYEADVNLKDYKGYSVIMAPSDSANPSKIHLEIIDILIKAGAKINEKNNRGLNALNIAKQRKLVDIIAKLESYGATD